MPSAKNFSIRPASCPQYFDGGRPLYLRDISAQAQQLGHHFPEDRVLGTTATCIGMPLLSLYLYEQYTDWNTFG
jgi:hypothetical protein